jgi:hypothetical protein
MESIVGVYGLFEVLGCLLHLALKETASYREIERMRIERAFHAIIKCCA